MRLCYVGNHGSAVGLGAEVGDGQAPATTENHWAAALELLGHEVLRVEEESTPWAARVTVAERCDMLLWTSTWQFEQAWPRSDGFRALRHLRDRGVPTAAVHLDRWWGLSNREEQIRKSPMFHVDHLFTADGDSERLWEAQGIRHHWLPPGVHAPECVPGIPRPEWASDVIFVGGWQDYGHSEHWDHRRSMLDALRAAFGERAAFWPKAGEPGPWGLAYNDLLASVRVVVGDGWRGANRYMSNRLFECVGRGGFMVHPAIPGAVELLPEGCGVAYFPPGDWDAMCAAVERWCADGAGRADAVAKGMEHVRAHHTYTHRMTEMLAVMEAEGAWR